MHGIGGWVDYGACTVWGGRGRVHGVTGSEHSTTGYVHGSTMIRCSSIETLSRNIEMRRIYQSQTAEKQTGCYYGSVFMRNADCPEAATSGSMEAWSHQGGTRPVLHM